MAIIVLLVLSGWIASELLEPSCSHQTGACGETQPKLPHIHESQDSTIEPVAAQGLEQRPAGSPHVTRQIFAGMQEYPQQIQPLRAFSAAINGRPEERAT